MILSVRHVVKCYTVEVEFEVGVEVDIQLLVRTVGGRVKVNSTQVDFVVEVRVELDNILNILYSQPLNWCLKSSPLLLTTCFE